MTKSKQRLTVLIIRLCLVYDHHGEASLFRMITSKVEKLVEILRATFQAFAFGSDKWSTMRVVLKPGSASDKACCVMRRPGIMPLRNQIGVHLQRRLRGRIQM